MLNHTLLNSTRKGLGLGMALALGLGLGISLGSMNKAQAQVFSPYGYGFGPNYGGYGTGYGYGHGHGYGYGYGIPFAAGSAGYNLATSRGAFGYGMSTPGPYMAAPVGIWGGMTPAGSAVLTQQTLALNASRFNMLNSQAALNYQAANMYNQIAAQTMLENYGQAKYGADAGGQRYPISGVGPGVSPGAEGEGAEPAAAQRRPLFGEDGRILWPESTPVGPELDKKRSAASESIQDVAQKSRRDGRAPVSAVVDAKEKLEDFGRDAIQELQDQNESEAAEDLSSFLQNMDYALSNYVNTTPRTETNVQDPPDAPKTGGDVLKESIRRENQDNGTSSQPRNPNPELVPNPDSGI